MVKSTCTTLVAGVILATALSCGARLKAKPGGDGGTATTGTGGASSSGGRNGSGAAASGSGGTGGGSSGASSSSSSSSGFMSQLRNVPVDKLDLLFMIDNSASMGDKQVLLAQAVPDMITRLVMPNCVDASGHIVGRSDMNGQCAAGSLEFRAVHDMHIGIVTSSLGGRGGNQCPTDATNETNQNLNAHNDDRGELINRGGAMEVPVMNAGSPLNFLAWFPPVPANAGGTTPVPAETTVGAPGMGGTLIGDFTSMIQGVHEHGCGFEAQNEAWYRFLVQPDPFDQIQVQNNRASLVGLDSVILQQRSAFLRPDSMLAVIVLTDENEEVADPLSIGGEGWLYESAPYPSSPTYGAPEGTIECSATPGLTSGPNDPNCTSCAFSSIQNSPNFAERCPDDPPAGMQGFLDPSDDSVNVRFYHQKQRFGAFAGYPIARYVRGLTAATVPDRGHEVDGSGNYVGDQDGSANCLNPIFAKDLPTDPNADLCHLERGPRTPDLVYYAAIAGVPHQLLQAQPGDGECSLRTNSSDCPQKNFFSQSDWQAITGADPEHYDFSGIDPHMLESEQPRDGLVCSPTDQTDDCDPINGREWSTNRKDLQFACIFPLVDAQTGIASPKDCMQPQYQGACDCASGSNSQNSPLCQKTSSGKYTTTQIYAKAYPSVREMEIARAMAASPSGVQGIVASLCPIHTSYANGDQTDPLFGYRPAVNAIVNRLKNSFLIQCLSQSLSVQSDGSVSCVVLVAFPNISSGESYCDNPGLGLSRPTTGIVARFQQGQGLTASQPVCLLNQIPTVNADYANCASSSPTAIPGWCYVEGQMAGICPQKIAFTRDAVRPDALLTVQCSN